MPEPETADAPPRLSRRARAAILGICVALFVLVRGPIWRHPYRPDASILWSYAPIPFLVLVALVAERKARVGSFFLETLLVAILKFGITATILVSIWTLSGPPPPRRAASVLPARPSPRPVTEEPSPTPLPDSATGDLFGRATLADGRPAAGSVVWVSSGLEAYRFAAQRGEVSMTIDSGRFTPDVVGLPSGRTLVVASRDGRLHTLDVRSAKETLANVAVLANGAPRAVSLAGPSGFVALRCDVHPDERAAAVVAAHPYVTSADGDGRFALHGVPAGALELTAADAAGPFATAHAMLAPRARLEVPLSSR